MTLKHPQSASFYEASTVPFAIGREKKRLWAALLDLLAEFDGVCRCHGITYSIDGGTLLGKMRHDGFIPWDDDVDVVMHRCEYEKLLSVADAAFQWPYFLQTDLSDPFAAYGHAKLRNSSMTGILRSQAKNGRAIFTTFNQGLFLDIFVLDAIPDDPRVRKAFFSELQYLQWMMWGARLLALWHIPLRGVCCAMVGVCVAMALRVKPTRIRLKIVRDPFSYYQKNFRVACKRFEGSETHEVSHVGFMPRPPASRIHVRSRLQDYMDVDFMGVKVSMFREWQYYLTNLYGDWHKYVIGTSRHGEILLDLDRPYTDYF